MLRKMPGSGPAKHWRQSHPMLATANSSSQADFPLFMMVDYVRVWQKQ